mmetsp:Transcript_6664/g.13535  ORF Transcript_6664/g.13535 Transcript_6664/m.13535 type:complete len:131 (+) Transcript_6664:352-744(+)
MQRIIAQILVVGGGYVVRAFAEAYRQAAANAGRQGAGAAGRASSVPGRRVMSTDEAAQILNVPRDAGLKQISERYDRMFHANDPAKGGSAYLQAKVKAARYILEQTVSTADGGIHGSDQQRPNSQGDRGA